MSSVLQMSILKSLWELLERCGRFWVDWCGIQEQSGWRKCYYIVTLPGGPWNQDNRGGPPGDLGESRRNRIRWSCTELRAPLVGCTVLHTLEKEHAHRRRGENECWLHGWWGQHLQKRGIRSWRHLKAKAEAPGLELEMEQRLYFICLFYKCVLNT